MEEIWKVYPHKTNKVHLLEVSNLGNINLSLGYHFGKDKIYYIIKKHIYLNLWDGFQIKKIEMLKHHTKR